MRDRAKAQSLPRQPCLLIKREVLRSSGAIRPGHFDMPAISLATPSAAIFQAELGRKRRDVIHEGGGQAATALTNIAGATPIMLAAGHVAVSLAAGPTGPGKRIASRTQRTEKALKSASEFRRNAQPQTGAAVNRGQR